MTDTEIRQRLSQEVTALNGFGDMFNLPDFEERRARLVTGLGKGGTDVVNRILCAAREA